MEAQGPRGVGWGRGGAGQAVGWGEEEVRRPMRRGWLGSGGRGGHTQPSARLSTDADGFCISGHMNEIEPEGRKECLPQCVTINTQWDNTPPGITQETHTLPFISNTGQAGHVLP